MSIFGLFAMSAASAAAARQARVSRGEADPLIADETKERARARARKLLGAQGAQDAPIVGFECPACGYELGEVHDELALAIGLDPNMIEEETRSRQQFLSDLIDIALFGAPYEELDYGVPADWDLQEVAISGRRAARRDRKTQRRAAKSQRQTQRQQARSRRQGHRQTRRGARPERRAQRRTARTTRQENRQDRRLERQDTRKDAQALRQQTRQGTRQAKLDAKDIAAQAQVDAAVDAADAAAWERGEAADWAQADADEAWESRDGGEDWLSDEQADAEEAWEAAPPAPTEPAGPSAPATQPAPQFDDGGEFEADDSEFDDDDFAEAESEADAEFEEFGAPEIGADVGAVAQAAVAAVGVAQRLARHRKESIERGEDPLVSAADVEKAKNRAFQRVKAARFAFRARRDDGAVEGDQAPRGAGGRPPKGRRPFGRGAVLHGDGAQGAVSTPDVGGVSLMDVGVDPKSRLRVSFLPVSLAEASELLVTLTKINIAQLRAGARPLTQGLATGEIRYARPETSTTLATLNDIWASGEADCAPLSAAYAAERTLEGNPSIPYLYYARPKVIHAVVRDLRTGELFDPSIAAGMGAP